MICYKIEITAWTPIINVINGIKHGRNISRKHQYFVGWYITGDVKQKHWYENILNCFVLEGWPFKPAIYKTFSLK